MASPRGGATPDPFRTHAEAGVMRSLPLILAMLAAPAHGSWCQAIDERPARALQPLALSAPLQDDQRYVLTVAVETDASLRELLGSVDAVHDYAQRIVSYLSAITERDMRARLELGYVSVWPGADPWPDADAVTRLRAVQAYWQRERSDTERSTVLLLSARSPWQGAAFVGALCDDTLSYSISQGLTGTVEVDALLVGHELGHTLGSPHSHCYGPEPVDACWGRERECYAGPTSLPGIGSLTGGEPGQQSGTMMSYCGYVVGGTAIADAADISPTFGRGHPFGLRADRIPDRMTESLRAASCVRVESVVPPAPRQVPTLGAVGVLVLALILGLIGARRIR
jgi:hypothetical protein